MSRSLRPAAVALGVVSLLALPAGALANSRPPNLTCEITPTTPFYSGT